MQVGGHHDSSSLTRRTSSWASTVAPASSLREKQAKAGHRPGHLVRRRPRKPAGKPYCQFPSRAATSWPRCSRSIRAVAIARPNRQSNTLVVVAKQGVFLHRGVHVVRSRRRFASYHTYSQCTETLIRGNPRWWSVDSRSGIPVSCISRSSCVL